MEYSIKKFAHLLVIQYSKLDCIDPDVVKSLGDFKKAEPTSNISNSIDLLLNSYKKFIDEISVANFEKFVYDTLPTKEEYMQHLISRCLKLSEGNPTFFEFLLVCVYICKMAECVYDVYNCCKILKFTANSLEAVYSREYKDYFKENAGFSGFGNFCRRLNECSPSVKYEKGEEGTMTIFSVIEPERNRKVLNFKYLKNVDRKVVVLTAEEVKFFVDESYLISSDRSINFFLDWSCKLVRLAREIDEEFDSVIKEWDVVPEKTHKTGVRCVYCKSKCFQYAKDIPE